MATFAKIGLNNKVLTVVCLHDSILLDGSGNPDETLGIEFLNEHQHYPLWVQTFKDRSKRKNYASAGHTYDEERDAFILKSPYASWVLNETTCTWEAPTTMPDDGQTYEWDEANTSWSVSSDMPQ